MTRPLLEVIASTDGLWVETPDHSAPSRARAALSALFARQETVDLASWPWWALAVVAEVGVATHLAQHITPPGGGCGCQEPGWWCETGDGPRTPFFGFEFHDLAEVDEYVAEWRTSRLVAAS